MRGLMGSLQVFPLPDLVELLSRRRASGALTCERGTVRKTAWLEKGAVVGASSNDPREYFGQFLVNFGHITEDQLARAYHSQGDSRARLGQILAAQGTVKADVVREVLAIKIRETLLDVYLWDAGLFQLETDGSDDGGELGARVELAEIGREAEFRATAWGAFRAAFPTGAATLVVHEEKVPKELAPATLDGRLLSLAREGQTIDELALALHMPDFHLYQRLFSLQKRGLLDAAAPAALGDLGAAELEAALVDRGFAPRLRLPLSELSGSPLPAADKYLLSRCDGSRTVGQLAELLPLPRLALLQTIQRHADAGAVELVVPV